MKFNEDTRVKIPTILHLMRLGYQYLSLKGQNWDLDTNIFPELFSSAITRIGNPPKGYVNNELNRYLTNKNYDAVAVCFAVRIFIEQLVYLLLTDTVWQEKFIAEHGTSNKLEVASSVGVDIPESYFLLGIIYNTNLHWNQGRDYVSPLASKLSHPTIKQLIASVVSAATNRGNPS